jgi:hypothetical protein
MPVYRNHYILNINLARLSKPSIREPALWGWFPWNLRLQTRLKNFMRRLGYPLPVQGNSPVSDIATALAWLES